MAEIYRGRGKKEDEEKLIAMLDNVFFLDDEDETRRDFLSLLPKLYKSEYEPAFNNMTVMEDGEFKGAVGLYNSVACAGGKKLRIGGIGNVAVARDSRRKGYMIECMNMCIDQMKSDGTDYSLLGGQRQRYGYFGYEPAGTGCSYCIDRTNIRHVCGKDHKGKFTAAEIKPGDRDILAKVNELYRSLPFYVEREENSLYDILCSWSSRPYAVFENGEFKGYFVIQNEGNWVQEFKPAKASDAADLALAIMDLTGKDSIHFTVPRFDTALTEEVSKICGDCEIDHCEMLSIFNYAAFIEGFLKVRAARIPLCDGSLVFLVHGIKGDEQFEVSVKNGEVSVVPTDKKPDAEYAHNEAVRAFAAINSEARNRLPAFAQTWFPVDFYSYSEDNV